MRALALSVVLILAAGPVGSISSAQTPDGPPPALAAPEVDYPASAVAGAVAVNLFRVPGKTILCGATTLVSTGLMLLTFGTQYRMVGAVFREGCGGKWIIGPGDLNRDVDPPRAIFSAYP